MTLNFLIFIASVAAAYVLLFFLFFFLKIIEILFLLYCCTVATVHFTQWVHFMFFFSFFAHSLCCCTAERDQILRMRNLLTNKAVPLLLINQNQVLTGTVAAEGIRIINQLLNMWEAHCHRLQKEKSWSLLISPGWYCCMSCSFDASKRNGWICNS